MGHAVRKQFRFRRTASLLLALAVLLSAVLSTAAVAGKEGVYISESVYFSLGDASLAAGSDKASLRFTLELNNGSDSAINFNGFGVRVIDGAGSSYAVQLTEKSTSRVPANTVQTYKYVSDVASGVTLNELRVVIFIWDSSQPTYMRDLGSLSVASAASSVSSAQSSATIDVKTIDSTLPDGAAVSFVPIASYKTAKDGNWTMYVDLKAVNLSTASFKLPAGLTYQLIDSKGYKYAANAVAGNDTLLPQQPGKLTLQATVGKSFAEDSFSVEFVQKVQNTFSTLGSLKVQSSPAGIAEVRPYASVDSNGLTITADQAVFSEKSDGVYYETNIVIQNDGSSTIYLPAISGTYQNSTTGYSTAAANVTAAPSFLAPGKAAQYRFTGTMPIGSNPASVSLVVSEKKTGSAAALPVGVMKLNRANVFGHVMESISGTVVDTSAGALTIRAKQTSRLNMETEDVLVSELEIENRTSGIIELPTLYGGFSIGAFGAEGKVVRIQSSSYLSPGQKTSVYVFSKVPYTLELNEGVVYIGEGKTAAGNQSNAANQSVTPVEEWVRISFLLGDEGLKLTPKDQEWTIGDSGRQSIGAIIDSQVFETGNNQKMLAVRILQTGKEKRSGSIVPYTGYFRGADGSIYNVSVTEDSGRLCNGCAALSTLWVKLPETMSSSVYDSELIFGQKLEGNIFANGRRFEFLPGTSVSPVSSTNSTGTNVIELGPFDLYPYSVSLKNVNIYGLVAAGTTKYEVSFTYDQGKMYPVAGGNKNRSLLFELRDAKDNIVQSWDIPFEGTGALQNGAAKLTADLKGIDVSNMYSPRLYVYEKFEGAKRLLGTSLR